MLISLGAGVTAATAALPGCVKFQVDPVEVKPIHIVMDVNIRIDRRLDEFFDFEKELSPPQPSATRPATAAALQPEQQNR